MSRSLQTHAQVARQCSDAFRIPQQPRLVVEGKILNKSASFAGILKQRWSFASLNVIGPSLGALLLP
jgi:hypothetical protein